MQLCNTNWSITLIEACSQLSCKQLLDRCRGLTRYRSDQGVQQWADDAQAQAQVRTSIETVLRQIYEEHLEVPVIAMHRKEVSCTSTTPLPSHPHHVFN